MKKYFVSLMVVVVGLFAISACAQSVRAGAADPCLTGNCAKAYNSADLRQPAPGQVSLRVQTYNNTKPGGNQLWVGVDSVEIRPNLEKNGAQLWFDDDDIWKSQGGKYSLLFPDREALKRYCAKPFPAPMELRAKTVLEPLCPSSVGKGQRWYSF